MHLRLYLRSLSYLLFEYTVSCIHALSSLSTCLLQEGREEDLWLFSFIPREHTQQFNEPGSQDSV